MGGVAEVPLPTSIVARRMAPSPTPRTCRGSGAASALPSPDLPAVALQGPSPFALPSFAARRPAWTARPPVPPSPPMRPARRASRTTRWATRASLIVALEPVDRRPELYLRHLERREQHQEARPAPADLLISRGPPMAKWALPDRTTANRRRKKDRLAPPITPPTVGVMALAAPVGYRRIPDLQATPAPRIRVAARQVCRGGARDPSIGFAPTVGF